MTTNEYNLNVVVLMSIVSAKSVLRRLREFLAAFPVEAWLHTPILPKLTVLPSDM